MNDPPVIADQKYGLTKRTFRKMRSYLPAIQIISTLIAAYSAVWATNSYLAASRTFALNSRLYDEQSYSRSQSAIALAWRTIDESNNRRYEAGQSPSILYLAQHNALPGRLILNGSTIDISERDLQAAPKGMYLNFDASSICGTAIDVSNDDKLAFGITRSLAVGASFKGQLAASSFTASDLSAARFFDVEAIGASFVAASMQRSTFHGGTFIAADFQGADMREIQTERGYDGNYYGYGDLYYDTSSPWVPLFSANVGIDEALQQAGFTKNTSNGNQIVDFSDAHFLHADMRGANLTDSNISQRQVNEACTDATTKLPSGRVSTGCHDELLVPEKRSAFQRLLNFDETRRQLCLKSASD